MLSRLAALQMCRSGQNVAASVIDYFDLSARCHDKSSYILFSKNFCRCFTPIFLRALINMRRVGLFAYLMQRFGDIADVLYCYVVKAS
jgi:hypothetical protein